jgi:hypothetical protein
VLAALIAVAVVPVEAGDLELHPMKNDNCTYICQSKAGIMRRVGHQGADARLRGLCGAGHAADPSKCSSAAPCPRVGSGPETRGHGAPKNQRYLLGVRFARLCPPYT